MSTPASTHTAAHANALPQSQPDAGGRGFVVDLSTIDLKARLLGRDELERWIPHRGEMMQIDFIVWRSEDFRSGVAMKKVRADEFWVPGHFPARPMLPGVLQVEASAQLAVYLYNARQGKMQTAAFTRIENCSFRNMVAPGDELLLLCQEIKWTRRGFVCRVQGVNAGKLTFDAEIHGLSI